MIINFRLLDETGNQLGSFYVSDREGDLVFNDLIWLHPSLFALTWNEVGGEASVLGVSRINALGQILPSVVYPAPEGERYLEIKINGDSSSAQVALTVDPTPNSSGLLSSESWIGVAPLGPCQ